MPSKEKAIQEKLRVAELRTEASFMKKKREAELQAESLRLEEEMVKAEARVKIYEQEKLEAKVQSENLVVTEESGRTRKYTWDGPLLTEQRDQRKNYVILRDRHRRDKKTSNKEGIEMTRLSALNIGNQNEMINQSYHEAGIFRRLFNFLIKCHTMSYSTSKNPLDSPDVICMILSKVPGYLQDSWNRNALRISDVTLLFEHSPSWASEIEHFEIFSCLRGNQLAR